MIQLFFGVKSLLFAQNALAGSDAELAKTSLEATHWYAIAGAGVLLITLGIANRAYRNSPWVQKTEEHLTPKLHARHILAFASGVTVLMHAITNTLLNSDIAIPSTLPGLALKISLMLIGTLLLFSETFFISGIGLFLAALFASLLMPTALLTLLPLQAAAVLLAATSSKVPFRDPFSFSIRLFAYHAFRLLIGLTLLGSALDRLIQFAMGQLPNIGIACNNNAVVFSLLVLAGLVGAALMGNFFTKPLAILTFLATLFFMLQSTTLFFTLLPFAAALLVLFTYGHTYHSKFQVHLKHVGNTSQISERLPF